MLQGCLVLIESQRVSRRMVDLELPGAIGLASHDNMIYQEKAHVGL